MKKEIVRYLRILFYVSFFLMCAVPVWFLSDAKISNQENRSLAEKPLFWKNGDFNKGFDEQFETYLKDHFPARSNLIKFYYFSQYAFLSKIENEKGFIGDDGWMFSFYPTRNNNIGVQRYVFGLVRDRIEKFIQFTSKKSVDIYFFIVPDRTQIYHQYWDKHYARRKYLSMGEEIKKTFSHYPNVYVFFPYQQLEDLSHKEEVFLKHDIHLWGKAAGTLVDSFVNILHDKYFPQATEYPKVVYEQGIEVHAHYANLLFLDMKRKMTEPKPVSGKYVSVEDRFYDGMNITTINENALSDKSVLVAGNCFAEILFGQLRELFYRTVLYRYNIDERISAPQKLSLKDIDIIVIGVSEDMMENMEFLDTLRDML